MPRQRNIYIYIYIYIYKIYTLIYRYIRIFHLISIEVSNKSADKHDERDVAPAASI